MGHEFNGYVRDNDQVGVRNHTLIMPISYIANHVAMQISKSVNGTVFFRHQHGVNQKGDDLLQTRKVLLGFAAHPNVYGLVIVGSGNEQNNLEEIAAHAETNGKVVEVINIQKLGGFNESIKKGILYAKQIIKQSDEASREPVS